MKSQYRQRVERKVARLGANWTLDNREPGLLWVEFQGEKLDFTTYTGVDTWVSQQLQQAGKVRNGRPRSSTLTSLTLKVPSDLWVFLHTLEEGKRTKWLIEAAQEKRAREQAH